MDTDGNCNTGSPDKLISVGSDAKTLKEVTSGLYGAQNRIVNWVKADVRKGLLGAEEHATLEAICKSLLDGIAYLEHVDRTITTFHKEFWNELK